MHFIDPKIFVIAETTHCYDGFRAMLAELGASQWVSDGSSPGEVIAEVAGRICYKSFSTELNANLTKVREGNFDYIGNLIKQQHGSVLEHATTSVAIIGSSRILTHELVRHRQGTAYSQESMRFVRLDDIGMYLPDLTKDFEELHHLQENEDDAEYLWANAQRDFADRIRAIAEHAERFIKEFTPFLDRPRVPFALKKKITSALRRIAPGGHTTNILVTANHRAWRYMIQQRTAAGAEEEIRQVFGMIAEDFSSRYMAFYQDMFTVDVEGSRIPECRFNHPKI